MRDITDNEFEKIKHYFYQNCVQTATRIGITGRLTKRFDYINSVDIEKNENY